MGVSQLGRVVANAGGPVQGLSSRVRQTVVALRNGVADDVRMARWLLERDRMVTLPGVCPIHYVQVTGAPAASWLHSGDTKFYRFASQHMIARQQTPEAGVRVAVLLKQNDGTFTALEGLGLTPP